MDRQYSLIPLTPTSPITNLPSLTPLLFSPTHQLTSPVLTSAGLSPTQFGPLPPISAMAGLSVSSRSSEERSVSSVSAPSSQVNAGWLTAGNNTNESKGPLERLGFKLMIGEKKTRDGQTPKRRGPKPDSKPALTRRQELNRQAQRTHRERKEMYIKALEQEVLRLKELFQQTTKERDAFAEENRKLKEILAAHGIHYELKSPVHMYPSGSSQFGGSTTSLTGSQTRGSMSTGYTSPPAQHPPPLPATAGALQSPTFDATQGQQPPQTQQPFAPPQRNPHGLDYDQIGIDFVLTLERPCMDHIQFLIVRSQDSDGEISGHTLMATCPPLSHIEDKPEQNYPHKMPDLGTGDLVKLLDLSSRLPLDGEITPIMAWAGIRSHPRCHELTKVDFDTLKEELTRKIRCYGFGAVLEDFEVQDAVTTVLATRTNLHADGGIEMGWTPPPISPDQNIWCTVETRQSIS